MFYFRKKEEKNLRENLNHSIHLRENLNYGPQQTFKLISTFLNWFINGYIND